MKSHFIAPKTPNFKDTFGNSVAELRFAIGGIGIESEGKMGSQAILYKNLYHRVGNKPSLSFGYFRADDHKFASRLFKELKYLARSLNISQIIGPINGSTWHSYRLMLPNGNPLFFTEKENPGEYFSYFQENGFHVLKDYHSNQVCKPHYDGYFLQTMKQQIQSLGWREATINKENLTSELTQMANFCNNAFQHNFLFSPIKPEVFVSLYLPLLSHIDTQFIRRVKNADGNIEALLLAFPDPLSSQKRLIIKTVCRNPSSRLRGLGNYLVQWATRKAQSQGYQEIIHAFIASDNLASAHPSKNTLRGACYRRYQLFINRL